MIKTYERSIRVNLDIFKDSSKVLVLAHLIQGLVYGLVKAAHPTERVTALSGVHELNGSNDAVIKTVITIDP